MPKNPSDKQRKSSRHNLKGHYGPKTAEGKHKVSLNGFSNRGTKNAKARARIIAARHGAKTATFYTYADCITCQKTCTWSTFSSKTPHNELPLGCLDEVLRNKPHLCFYHLEGFCAALPAGKTPGTASGCVLQPHFLDNFQEGRESVSPQHQELHHRLQMIRFKNEAANYMEELRRHGPETFQWTPRKKYVLRTIQTIIARSEFCVLESWRNLRQCDEIIQWLMYARI